jgi:hypothetical protein
MNTKMQNQIENLALKQFTEQFKNKTEPQDEHWTLCVFYTLPSVLQKGKPSPQQDSVQTTAESGQESKR